MILCSSFTQEHLRDRLLRETPMQLIELHHSNMQIHHRPIRGEVLKTDRMDVVLYVGLGMVAVGLVNTVVGLGDKGFKTFELKIVGPSIIVCGAVLAGARIVVCVWPEIRRGRRRRRQDTLLDREERQEQLHKSEEKEKTDY